MSFCVRNVYLWPRRQPGEPEAPQSRASSLSFHQKQDLRGPENGRHREPGRRTRTTPADQFWRFVFLLLRMYASPPVRPRLMMRPTMNTEWCKQTECRQIGGIKHQATLVFVKNNPPSHSCFFLHRHHITDKAPEESENVQGLPENKFRTQHIGHPPPPVPREGNFDYFPCRN